jgi:hypothetical protein
MITRLLRKLKKLKKKIAGKYRKDTDEAPLLDNHPPHKTRKDEGDE